MAILQQTSASISDTNKILLSFWFKVPAATFAASDGDYMSLLEFGQSIEFEYDASPGGNPGTASTGTSQIWFNRDFLKVAIWGRPRDRTAWSYSNFMVDQIDVSEHSGTWPGIYYLSVSKTQTNLIASDVWHHLLFRVDTSESCVVDTGAGGRGVTAINTQTTAGDAHWASSPVASSYNKIQLFIDGVDYSPQEISIPVYNFEYLDGIFDPGPQSVWTHDTTEGGILPTRTPDPGTGNLLRWDAPHTGDPAVSPSTCTMLTAVFPDHPVYVYLGGPVTVDPWDIAINGLEIGIPQQQFAEFPLTSYGKIQYAYFQMWAGIAPELSTAFNKFVNLTSPTAGTALKPSVARATYGQQTYCFQGGAGTFQTNRGTGGSFNKTGTLANASPGPSYSR